jgi:hypothetical protein
MTFIKGPVCNGSFAVNSIQEQFYVFFMNPKSDLMVRYQKYAEKVASQLVLPGSLGSNLSIAKIATNYADILEHREQAREDHNQQLHLAFPQGMKLTDLWDGDGTNSNAVLTVFRNDDNAKVFRGAKGDTPKTAFVLDYSTFERMVYNLVINFDVFDNVSHQTLTRLYMDVLRMDAEDNFLQFLPPADRLKTKSEWYRGVITKLKLRLLNENHFASMPQGIPFSRAKDRKTEFIQQILTLHLADAVKGPPDLINWKTLKSGDPQTPIERQLKRISSIRAAKQTPFPNFFPELADLIILNAGVPTKIYSILRNREHENLSWITQEDARLAPSEDTLTILPGTAGGYPNRFFAVEEQDLSAMIDQIQALKTKRQFNAFLKKYGIDRMDDRFWSLYDFANSELSKREPVEAGVLDLSRYDLSSK